MNASPSKDKSLVTTAEIDMKTVLHSRMKVLNFRESCVL
jgi:hypothetical protein